MGVFAELSSYLRKPYYVPSLSSRHSAHESVKAQLYVLGFKLGYRSVLEAKVCGSVRTGQIDCVYVDRLDNVVCAFEVDGSVRSRSVAKLFTLGPDVEKIVISFGTDDSWRKMAKKTGCSEGFGDIRFFRMGRD